MKYYGDKMIDKILQINMLLDFYGKLLSPKQEKSISMYYIYDFSINEIAEELSISKQAVSDNIKRAEQNLRIYEKSLQLVEKYNNKIEENLVLKDLFNKLECNSKEIDKDILKSIYSIIFKDEEVY